MMEMSWNDMVNVSMVYRYFLGVLKYNDGQYSGLDLSVFFCFADRINMVLREIMIKAKRRKKQSFYFSGAWTVGWK